jgi:hypothetical protein
LVINLDSANQTQGYQSDPPPSKYDPLYAAMAFINESPSDVARGYFVGDSKTKKEAALSVARYGITAEMGGTAIN